MAQEEEKISSNSRREFLKRSGICCATLLAVDMLPSLVSRAGAEVGSPPSVGGQAGNVKEVLRNYFGGRKISMAHVGLKVPIIAENGAVVPIKIGRASCRERV